MTRSPKHISASLLSFLAAGSGGVGCAANTPLQDAGSPPEAEAAIDSGTILDASSDVISLRDSDAVCSPDGFCTTLLPGIPPPSPTGIFAASPTRTLASSAEGKVLLWNGSSWSTLLLGLSHLGAVWASDADHFWVVDTGPFGAWSMIRITFQGDQVIIGHETLPGNYGSCQQASLSVSGTSEDDIFVAAYCYGLSVPNGVFQSDTRGVLFHRAPDADTGDAGSSWSVVWSDGDPTTAKVALGGVYAVAHGEALAVGWRAAPYGYYPEAKTYIPVGYAQSDDPGTRTFMLHVKDGVIDEETLDVSLASCAQSVWSSPSMDNVFVGGNCNAYNLGVNDYETKKPYPIVVRRHVGQGGVAEWNSVIEAPFLSANGLEYSINNYPSILWGFGEDDVYAVGSYAEHWDGTQFQFIKLALNGAPFAARATAVHGSSPSDLWIVGGQAALHRKQ